MSGHTFVPLGGRTLEDIQQAIIQERRNQLDVRERMLKEREEEVARRERDLDEREMMLDEREVVRINSTFLKDVRVSSCGLCAQYARAHMHTYTLAPTLAQIHTLNLLKR